MTDLFSKIIALRTLEPPLLAPPSERPCRLCGAPLRHGAVKCNECGALHGWRRFFPATEVTLSLLIALFSVLGTVGPRIADWLHRHSETKVYIAGGDADALIVEIANEGNEASMIRSFRAQCWDMHLTEIVLKTANPDEAYLLPNTHRSIRLYRAGPPTRPVFPKTINEVMGIVDGIEHGELPGTVHLIAQVHESTDNNPEHTTARVDSLPGAQLAAWIKGMVQ